MNAWSLFLNKIETTIDKLSKTGCDIIFFRGHGNSSWSLKPSLGRKVFDRNIESILYYDFMQNAGSLIPPNITSWDILFSMRHHSLPTRLLDWTQNFCVALYFAIKNFDGCAAIWILDPFEINRAWGGESVLLHPQIDLDDGYVEYFIKESKVFPSKAIAILPPKTNQRIIAQKAGFTLHGNLDDTLDSLFPGQLTKIELPESALSDAKRFLQLAGISEYSLFPDLDGLSRWMHEIHDL